MRYKFVLFFLVLFFNVVSHSALQASSVGGKYVVTDEASARECCDSLMNIFTSYLDELKDFQVYNDSIYMGMDSTQWIPFFKRRAKVYSEFYKVNTQRVRTMRNLLDASRVYDISQYSDSLIYQGDTFSCLKTNSHIMLLMSIYDVSFLRRDRMDLFLFEDLLLNIGPDIERLMPNSDYAYFYYSSLAWCKYLVASVAHDESLELSWKYFEKVRNMHSNIERYLSNSSQIMNVEQGTLYAVYFAMDISYAYNGVISLEEVKQNVDSANEFVKSHPDYFKSHVEASRWILSAVKSYPIRVIRQFVWKENYDFHSEMTDEAALDYIAIIENRAHKDTLTMINLKTMQVYLGQIPANEARDFTYDYLRRNIFNNYKGYYKLKLQTLSSQLYSLLYLNDKAEIPEEQKAACVEEVVSQLIMAMRACKNSQEGDVKGVIGTTYAALPLVINHMSLERRVEYLRELFVSCQVQTATHSRMVSRLSVTLLNGVIKYKPELLAGLPQVPSVKALKRNKALRSRLQEFMGEAALCHDMGKMSMAEIVRNDFRPLTDHEFAVLKTHPARGLKFLNVTPTKNCYRDLIEGHHKWYNGKRGYPEPFDNVHSQYHVLIDILSICDCLEAATDQLGRRYADAKKFDMMMHELKGGAGSRYNAELVQLIEDHADLAEQFRYMIEEGWYQNYYEIYHKYFCDEEESEPWAQGN